MRISYGLVLAASSALAIPIPTTYTWGFTNWSSGWVGTGWANFQVSAVETTVSGVTIPALSLASNCNVVTTDDASQDCSSKIAGDKTGRTLHAKIRPFDNDGVKVDFVYQFTAGGKTYTVDAFVSRASNGYKAFTITPTSLQAV